jgi:hypothetical protein
MFLPHERRGASRPITAPLRRRIAPLSFSPRARRPPRPAHVVNKFTTGKLLDARPETRVLSTQKPRTYWRNSISGRGGTAPRTTLSFTVAQTVWKLQALKKIHQWFLGVEWQPSARGPQADRFQLKPLQTTLPACQGKHYFRRAPPLRPRRAPDARLRTPAARKPRGPKKEAGPWGPASGFRVAARQLYSSCSSQVLISPLMG